MICFYTGQGVTCDLTEYGLYTGQFSSCSPLILFNEKTGRGGMFHMPGKKGDEDLIYEEWVNHIGAMFDDVQPTRVLVFPSGYARPKGEPPLDPCKPKPGYALKRGDRDVLADMLEQYKQQANLGYVVTVEKYGVTGILVSAPGGTLQTRTMLSGSETRVDLKTTAPSDLPGGCKVYNPNIDYSLWR